MFQYSDCVGSSLDNDTIDTTDTGFQYSDCVGSSTTASTPYIDFHSVSIQ